jgi:hypothetical protein
MRHAVGVNDTRAEFGEQGRHGALARSSAAREAKRVAERVHDDWRFSDLVI